jgi:hypothetical protein
MTKLPRGMRKIPGPDDCAHMTLEEFTSNVKAGAFIDYDGMGYYATDKEMTDIRLNLPEIAKGNMLAFSHVVWFNK